MPKLEWLIMAQAARIEPDSGLVNVLGGGWSRLAVPELPSHRQVTAVGRLAFDLSEGPPSADLRVTFRSPAGSAAREDGLSINVSVTGDASQAVDGVMFVVWALNSVTRIDAYGLARVDVEADGVRIGGLTYEVVAE